MGILLEEEKRRQATRMSGEYDSVCLKTVDGIDSIDDQRSVLFLS